MKFAIFPLSLLAFALALTSPHTRASDQVPLRFLSPAVTVTETDSVARLQVLRADDADHPIKVDFLTEPGTATPDVDYAPVTGTLTFGPGEHFKLLEIPILNSGVTESSETFRVVLTNATEGSISELYGVATVTIRDNDPGLGFETSTYNTSETQAEVVLSVRRGTDARERISVTYTVEPDTASPQLDYLPVNGTLFFEPDDLVQPIRVSIVQDSRTEPIESFRVILSDPSAGVSLGTPNAATVRISDNDQGFSFSASTYNFDENQGELTLAVSRGTDAPGEISVEYSIEAGSATPELDYTPVQGTLVFSAGQPSAAIRVPIINDGLKEPVETFRMILSNPSAGALLGAPGSATVRILDNDAGFLFPDGSTYTPSESDGELMLAVSRGSDAPGEISVDYSVEPVSATPNLDYTAVQGTLIFAAGTAWQSIRVPILNDSLKEPVESFRVVLRNPSNGVSVGSPNVATVRIGDNDPGFAFGEPSSSVSEMQKEVILRLSRTGTGGRGQRGLRGSIGHRPSRSRLHRGAWNPGFPGRRVFQNDSDRSHQ